MIDNLTFNSSRDVQVVLRMGREEVEVEVESVEGFRRSMEKIFSVSEMQRETKLAVMLVVLRKVVGRRADFSGLLEEVFEQYGDFKMGQYLY